MNIDQDNDADAPGDSEEAYVETTPPRVQRIILSRVRHQRAYSPKDSDEPEREQPGAIGTPNAKTYAAFVFRSLRRRPKLIATVSLSILIGALLMLWAMPRTYHVEAKLLAQRNQALQVRGDGPNAEAQTRAAAETVLRRSNLTGLIDQTDLIRHWDEHRAPGVRLFDAIMTRIVHRPTDQDRVDDMVERLEKRLTVWSNEGTVTIAVDWPDARMAQRLVELSQQNFLETRHAQEITAIGESLAILESHAKGLRADIDDAVAAVGKIRTAKDKEGTGGKGGDAKAAANNPAPAAPPPKAEVRSAADAEEADQLRASIAAKQRALDELQDIRQKRLSELRAKLSDLRGTLTPNHPTVIDLQQTIDEASGESPQVRALRSELSELRSRYGGSARDAGEAPLVGGRARARGAASPLPSDVFRLESDLREDRDPAVTAARGQLRDAMDKYAALRTQVEAAQIDLETAEAAFKYRYMVVTPAQLPRRPTKPNVPLVLVAALFSAIVSALAAAVIADVYSRRLVDRSQIEGLLSAPILGETELPALPIGGSGDL